MPGKCIGFLRRQGQTLICHWYVKLCTIYSTDLTDEVQFEKVTIEVPYVHGGTEDMRAYTVHCRSSMKAILDAIQDPDLLPSLTYYPEHHYILNPRTNTNMRVWTDIYTGDEWWKLQVCSAPFSTLYLLMSDRIKLVQKRL